MPEDLMRYDQLAQIALKGVVREALKIVERTGLPGEHHFYIAFNTRHPMVILSERLAARYPREMTIVLQHQYWGLKIFDDHFEVELSFDDIPEKLVVPFDAVKGFLDPAVQFGLQFETVQATASGKDGETATPAPANSSDAREDRPAEAAEPDVDAPKVVSLDAFRKK